MFPCRTGEIIASRRAAIHSCVRRGEQFHARISFSEDFQKNNGEARDPSPDFQARRELWSIMGEQMSESCCSKAETVCSEWRFPGTAELRLMFRDKQKEALMHFKRRPSMIIGTWMERSLLEPWICVTRFALLNNNPPEKKYIYILTPIWTRQERGLSDTLQSHHTNQPERFKLRATLCK